MYATVILRILPHPAIFQWWRFQSGITGITLTWTAVGISSIHFNEVGRGDKNIKYVLQNDKRRGSGALGVNQIALGRSTKPRARGWWQRRKRITALIELTLSQYIHIYISNSFQEIPWCRIIVTFLAFQYGRLAKLNSSWNSQNAVLIHTLAIRLWLPSGPIFCLLLSLSSDYAQPITGQVTEVTCPVIGRAQPELTPCKRQKTGPEANTSL